MVKSLVGMVLAGFTFSGAAKIDVGTESALLARMREAKAGDTILVAPGTYTGNTETSGDPGNLPNGKGYFWIGNDGTAQHPIVVMAKDSANQPRLQGTDIKSGYVVHVTGDHVVLRNLIMQRGDKVVMFDNANHGILENCVVRESGSELVHVRDGSSNVTISRNLLQNSGLVSPNFGEGIYVGTDQARWGADDMPTSAWGDKAVSEGFGGYDWRVAGTRIFCNQIEDIAAELIDIKEGTRNTFVQYNVFDGDSTGRKGGSTYFSYVGSFVDQKGVLGTMTGNTFFRGSNGELTDFIAEVKRTFPHVPANLTPEAHAKPWCDTKSSMDSNRCFAAENTVATQKPKDARDACPLPPVFGTEGQSTSVHRTISGEFSNRSQGINWSQGFRHALPDGSRHNLAGRLMTPEANLR